MKTQEQANQVQRQVQRIYGQEWTVILSMDYEYFILEHNGESFHQDSACEDVYDVESATSFFKDLILESCKKEYTLCIVDGNDNVLSERKIEEYLRGKAMLIAEQLWGECMINDAVKAQLIDEDGNVVLTFL